VFECRQCGHKQDRDLNAVINLKHQGPKELEGVGIALGVKVFS